jgi:hypothetical protein
VALLDREFIHGQKTYAVEVRRTQRGFQMPEVDA